MHLDYFPQREKFHLVQQLITHVKVEVRHGQQPVVIIDNVATVDDLSKNVAKIIPRNLRWRSFHVVLKANHRIAQITEPEWIVDVVPHRTKLLPLHDNGMEMAKAQT